MPKLTVMRGDDVVGVMDLASTDQRIGRGQDNDIVLPDEGKAVSRCHAELRHEGDGFVVIDLGSQNGTWINGERVTRAAVSAGAEIAIGPYRLVWSETGDPPQVRPVSGAEPPSTLTGTAARPASVETAVASTGGTQKFRHTSAVVAPAPANQSGKKKSAVRPPATPAALAAPGRAGDPIAWLARQPKPLVLGGFLVLVIATTFLRPSATPAPAPEANGDSGAAPVAPPIDPVIKSPNAETIARHLTEARKLEATQEYERAIREHLDQALLVDPRYSETVELMARFRDLAAKATPQVPAPEVPPVAPPPPPPPPPQPPRQRLAPVDADPNLLPRVAGESLAVWQARNATLGMDYQQALERLQAQDWLQAISRLESVAARHPTYRDVVLRLEETHASLQESVRAAIEMARSLEAKGDLVGALREYQRAGTLGHAAADGLGSAVSDRMRREGQDAFTRARQYDALGRQPEAIALYERAARYLATDNPNRKIAEDRLQRLRGGA